MAHRYAVPCAVQHAVLRRRPGTAETAHGRRPGTPKGKYRQTDPAYLPLHYQSGMIALLLHYQSITVAASAKTVNEPAHPLGNPALSRKIC